MASPLSCLLVKRAAKDPIAVTCRGRHRESGRPAQELGSGLVSGPRRHWLRGLFSPRKAHTPPHEGESHPVASLTHGPAVPSKIAAAGLAVRSPGEQSPCGSPPVPVPAQETRETWPWPRGSQPQGRERNQGSASTRAKRR